MSSREDSSCDEVSSINLCTIIISTTAGIFLAVVGLSSAAFPDGPLYPFDIESLLTCHVENPMAGVEGQPEFIAEDVPRLPFEQIVTQSPHPHVIWLPGESG